MALGSGLFAQTTLITTEATHVRANSYKTKNYGTSVTMEVKNEGTSSSNTRRAYLKFDLSSLTGAVSSAKLRLKVNDRNESSQTHEVRLVTTDTWLESSLTWSNQPAYGSIHQSVSVPAAASWIEFDVTTLAAQQLAGDKILSLAITAKGATYMRYHSDEAATAADRPVLVVTTVADSIPNILTTSLSGINTGAAYSQQLSVTGGNTPNTWSLSSGTLPTGLALSSSGLLSGTPTTGGTYSFTVKVTDVDSDIDTQALSLVVTTLDLIPNITTTTLTGATKGSSYSQQLLVSSGDAPNTWSLNTGSSLPAGLSLSSSGLLSGTPTTAGTYSFTVKVTDVDGDIDTQALSLTVLTNNPVSGMPSTSETLPAGLTAAFQLPSAANGNVISVVSYGATPNNSADDDGPKIAAAIAAASSGDTVLIPNGTYHVKTRRSIQLKTGVNLKGESQSGAIVAASFSTVTDNTGSYLVEAAQGVNNLTISDLTLTMIGGQSLRYALWLGQGTIVTANEAGRHIYGNETPVYRILVKNLKVTGFEKMGISLRNAYHVKVEGCTVTDASALGGGGEGYGIMLGYPKTTNCWVINNTCGPVIRHGILLQYEANHNLVESNFVTGTEEDAIDLHGEDEYCNDIYNNVITNALSAGIGLGNTGGTPEHYNSGPNNLLRNNEISGCERGIYIMNESDNQVMRANYIHDNTDIGIYVTEDGGDNLVADSNILIANKYGVRFEAGAGLQFTNNTVNNSTSYAAKFLSGVTAFTITGNDFRYNGSRVEVSNLSAGTYSGNLE
jgi:parallel beta-helix repeat protein